MTRVLLRVHEPEQQLRKGRASMAAGRVRPLPYKLRNGWVLVCPLFFAVRHGKSKRLEFLSAHREPAVLRPVDGAGNNV